MTVDPTIFAIFVAVSLPAFFIGHHMRTPSTRGIAGRGDSGELDPGLAGFIGKAMHGIGALIVATGLALSTAPRAYQMPIGIAFVVACNLLVVAIVFRAWRSRQQRRER